MRRVGHEAQSAKRLSRSDSGAALTAAGWVAGVVVTGTIVGTPYLLFGYHSPALHLVVDTVDACVGLLLAYLLWGRFLRHRRWQDLVLAEGMFLLAGAGLMVALLVSVMPAFRAGNWGIWLALTLRVAGSAMVLASALAWQRRTLQRMPWGRGQVTLWAVLALVVGVVVTSRQHLPAALTSSPPVSAGHPVITGHPALVAGQSVSALCFLAASVAFAAQSARRPDELLRWLGLACALAGFARVNYVLFPSLYSGWVYTGDLLRTSSYVVLLVGAGREISQHWAAQSRAAVLEDRRRLARELHDGLLQELAYIRLEAQAATREHAAAARLVSACDRARDEARAAVDALGWSPDEPLGFVLHRAARQVADRHAARVDVDLDDSVTADQRTRNALMRITREAVTNALTHGQARRICLRVGRDGSKNRLVVEDDGLGFDPANAGSSDGYGLLSMEERARGLGGSFAVESAPDSGTKVQVSW